MRYLVLQHAIAVGDKFRVCDEQRNQVLQIASKPMRQAMVLSDASAAVRAVIRTKTWPGVTPCRSSGTAWC
jgi:hypothetical protein